MRSPRSSSFRRPSLTSTEHLSVAQVRGRLENLAERLSNDLAFYRAFGLNLCSCESFSIDPVEKYGPTQPNVRSKPLRDVCELWGTIVKRLLKSQIRRNHAAYVIQSLWRMREGHVEVPDTQQFVTLELSDWQEAEVRALEGLKDGELSREYERALRKTKEEEEEEEEEEDEK